MSPADDTAAVELGLAVLDVLDPDGELTSEELDVRTWRLEQLIDHGYDVEDALAMAKARHIDLERARALVSRQGCTPRLAARILL